MDKLEITSLGGNCPVQGEGFIDGYPFYFRARGESWSLEISKRGDSEVALGNDAKFELEVWGWYGEPGEMFGAGWMEIEEAEKLIIEVAALFVGGLRGTHQLNPDPVKDGLRMLADIRYLEVTLNHGNPIKELNDYQEVDGFLENQPPEVVEEINKQKEALFREMTSKFSREIND